MYGGAIVVALSMGNKEAHAAAEAVARSIVRAVEVAPTLGGVRKS